MPLERLLLLFALLVPGNGFLISEGKGGVEPSNITSEREEGLEVNGSHDFGILFSINISWVLDNIFNNLLP